MISLHTNNNLLCSQVFDLILIKGTLNCSEQGTESINFGGVILSSHNDIILSNIALYGVVIMSNEF